MGPNQVLIKTYTAEGAVTAGCAAVAGASVGKVKLPTGANASAFKGVFLHDAADGQPVAVMKYGLCQAKAAGAIADGAFVEIADAQGRFTTLASHTHIENTAGAYTQNATTGTLNARFCAGIADSAPAAANELFDLLLLPTRA